jgi:hypothetical protein
MLLSLHLVNLCCAVCCGNATQEWLPPQHCCQLTNLLCMPVGTSTCAQCRRGATAKELSVVLLEQLDKPLVTMLVHANYLGSCPFAMGSVSMPALAVPAEVLHGSSEPPVTNFFLLFLSCA